MIETDYHQSTFRWRKIKRKGESHCWQNPSVFIWSQHAVDTQCLFHCHHLHNLPHFYHFDVHHQNARHLIHLFVLFSGKSYSAILFLLEQHKAKRKHETGLELLSSYPPDFFPLQTFNHFLEMCTCTYFSLFVLRNAERDDDGGFYCSISTHLHSYCFFEPVCETMDSRKFNFSPKLITLLERTGS